MTGDRSEKIDLHSVIRLSLENSGKFLEDAEILMKNSSYGHAYAFTVLALEELGKAVYCNWTINGGLKIDDDFFKRLTNHKIKQKVIKEVLKLTALATEIKKYTTDKKMEYPFETSTESSFFFHDFEELPQIKCLEAYCGSLEGLKQRALYVDVSESGALSSPSAFTRVDCNSNLEYVKSLLIVAKQTMLETKETLNEAQNE
jgi:AbiV family abortive infection protein